MGDNLKRDSQHAHLVPGVGRGIQEDPPLVALNIEQLRNGAIAGGGIGGDEPIEDNLLEHQASDMQEIDIQALSTAESDARDRILRANERIAQRLRIVQSRTGLIERKARLVNSMRSILRPPVSFVDRAAIAMREPFVPCIDVLYTALEQHLTGAFDDDAVFAECFPGIADDAQQNLLRDGFARLLKDSMLQNIDLTVVPQALTQILWNDDPLRMMVSASGSIVAIIFAKEALLLFANSVLGVMTFGFLDVNRLTDLCFWVYNNCTLDNIQNLLVYFSVSPEVAQQFIRAIRQYNREQRQYIIMSIYLLGLNAVQNGVAGDNLDQIMHRLQGQQPGQPGVNVAGDNVVPVAVAANPQAAAVNLQAAAAAAGAAGAAAAAAPPPAAAVPPVTLAELLLQAGTDILSVIRQIYLYAWSRGLRMTASCLREVLTVYVRRQPQDRGLAFNLVNLAGTVSRWGVGLLQGASAQLDPAVPNQEVLRLMLTAMNINVGAYNQDQIEVAMWDFTQMLKNNSTAILEDREVSDRCVYLSDPNAQGCLDALRTYFLVQDMGGQEGHVNMERFQTACLGMGLFVFEQDKKQDFIVENYGREVPLQDSLQVQTSISQSRNNVEQDLQQELDGYTKKSISRAANLCRKFATFQHEGLGRAGIAGGAEQPAATPLQVQLRQVQGDRIRSTKKQVMSGIESKIRSSDLSEAQKAQIISDLVPIVGRIDETGLVDHLLSARPTDAPPATFIQTCQAVLDAPIPPSILGAQRVVREAVYNGFNRCAASLTNFAVVSSNSVQAGLTCVRGIFRGIFGGGAAAVEAVPAVQAVPAVPDANRDEAARVIEENIIGRVVNELEPPERGIDVDLEPGAAAVGQGNGRRLGGRSRKRSASKRTRRKAKQSSKKLKRKSRRYVRHRRSTRRKN